MKLDPCYVCGLAMGLFKEGGQYVARCPDANCRFEVDHLGTAKRDAIRFYNEVARAPLAADDARRMAEEAR